MPYIPSEPYIFKSGLYPGKSMEILMFHNYGYLIFMFHKLGQVKRTIFEEHLAWIITQGENRKSKLKCSFCNTQIINTFLIRQEIPFRYITRAYNTSCQDNLCWNSLVHEAGRDYAMKLPIKFSSILDLQKYSYKRIFIRALRNVFLLPNHLTNEVAFRFFAE